jgi:hypothetical protein
MLIRVILQDGTQLVKHILTLMGLALSDPKHSCISQTQDAFDKKYITKNIWKGIQYTVYCSVITISVADPDDF